MIRKKIKIITYSQTVHTLLKNPVRVFQSSIQSESGHDPVLNDFL